MSAAPCACPRVSSVVSAAVCRAGPRHCQLLACACQFVGVPRVRHLNRCEIALQDTHLLAQIAKLHVERLEFGAITSVALLPFASDGVQFLL